MKASFNIFLLLLVRKNEEIEYRLSNMLFNMCSRRQLHSIQNWFSRSLVLAWFRS